MMNPDARRWIEALRLVPHPEGGWFRATYRAGRELSADTSAQVYDGTRPLCTAIYYLLAGSEVSLMHRLPGDELWHHYAGDGLTLHLLLEADDCASEPAADGSYRALRLGSDLAAGQEPQALIPGGCWFGATIDGLGNPDDPDVLDNPGKRGDIDNRDDLTAPNPYALVGCTMAPGFAYEDLELAERGRLCAIFPVHADLITRLTPPCG